MACSTLRPRFAPLALVLSLMLLGPSPLSFGSTPDEEEAPTKPRRPDLTDPVICLNVRGFRDFIPRDEPILTPDQKLEVYYEPFNFLILRDADRGRYRAHLVEDVHIRRAGSPRRIQSLPAAIDYSPRSEEPPTALYLHTTISLKDLPPGSYELDLVLRDRLGDGPSETTHTLSFQVVSSLPVDR
ncbi:hypothetical protein [Tautonia marina]|uniref:hypothetical protein n=1 Tax=Tautonia marina TaxID=2653855 RepID=UPI00126063C0|nr:hypothetical protein [Tautonia marina]